MSGIVVEGLAGGTYVRDPGVNLHYSLLISIFAPIARAIRRANMKEDLAKAEEKLDAILARIDDIAAKAEAC